jgi:hypothetical protein
MTPFDRAARMIVGGTPLVPLSGLGSPRAEIRPVLDSGRLASDTNTGITLVNYVPLGARRAEKRRH